jgi:signal transduction histidine kinase
MRLRLTLWVVAIFSIIQWSSGAVFWLYQSASMNRLFDEQLMIRASEVADEIEPWLPEIDEQELARITINNERIVQFDIAFVEVYHADGSNVIPDRESVILEDAKQIALAASQAAPVMESTEIRVGSGDEAKTLPARAVFIHLDTDGRGEFVVVMARSDAFVQGQLALLRNVLLLAGIIGPLAAAVAGWFIGGIAVAPFERLSALAKNLRPESIGRQFEMDSSNSEVVRLADELDLARQRILEGFAAQERFLSNVSHEIKTPIAVMLMEAQTLDTSESSQNVKDFVDSASEEMLRLGRLVESFLTLTRVRDGKGLATVKDYAANDLVIDSAEHCAPMARQYRVRLAPKILSDESTMHVAVAGDPELLCTMLDNLVRNAIRFSPEDERVEIEASVDGDRLKIRVRDYGPGIPEAQLATIFDRFAQAPEEHRNGRGHGLGLAIAQGIAELHGGSIIAENCEDRGCTFIVDLPQYSPNATSDDPATGTGTSR